MLTEGVGAGGDLNYEAEALLELVAVAVPTHRACRYV